MSSSPLAHPLLIVVVGAGGGIAQMIAPPAGSMRIGRATDNDISRQDPRLSRYHAVLHFGATVQLQDLGSENGTYVRFISTHPVDGTTTVRVVNTRLKNETIEVCPGTIIDLGSTTILLQSSELAAATPMKDVARPAWFARSPTMEGVWDLAARAASGQITVLLMGETGVGKEVVASHIHRMSSRANKPFLRLNCAAFTEGLLESELFGHEKGAFTSAVTAKPGLFESAHLGTILLDEIGELPMSLQSKLLRVLEDREVMRLGAVRPRPIDVRIIAATNRRLSEEVAQGRFRGDLFFRLYGLQIEIPPLRERQEEIRPLVLAFIDELSARDGRRAPTIDDEAMMLLEHYPWPGNIRELRHVVERALVVTGGSCIRALDLPESVRIGRSVVAASETAHLGEHVSEADVTMPADVPGKSDDAHANDLERQRTLEALERFGWNQTRAARYLQISRRVLAQRLERYGVPRPRK